MTTAAGGPLDDIAKEAARLLAAAAASALALRLTGGLAVAFRARGDLPGPFARAYGDIDLVAPKGAGRTVERFMAAMGYTPERQFNALNGGRRLLFFDAAHERQVDVFVGRFRMCHELPIAARLELEPDTVPLAELLLTKLQIYELNEKDRGDILAILLDHDVADHDGDAINGAYVARLLADDWGLWRTVRLNLDRSRDALAAATLPDASRDLVAARIDALSARIDAEPKSLRWRLRDRVGDRVRWYELPEEVG